MSPPNPELELARAFVEETDCPVFLTGRAGTGKTTFLHDLKARTPKRLVVTAPTGVAAINAGGVTLHSFFQLPFGPFLADAGLSSGQHRLSREKRNLINSLDLLVIDEVSMVRADLLDGVDAVLRRYRRSEQPFGGVQLLLIGDLHQLAPVAKEAEWQLLRPLYPSPYFFDCLALKRLDLVPIGLRHIYRQADQRFIDLLNQVRDNRLDAAGLETLNGRYRPDYLPGEGVITLCTHNSGAETINRVKMAALPGAPRRFEAEVEGSFPEYARPTAATLEMKIGAQVMFVRNDTATERRFFNGKIGAIVAMEGKRIRVRCPGEAEAIEVAPITWENVEYKVDEETAEIAPKVIGSFTQYPLKPAWAITIHKSQGLTFDQAVIDAQAAFAPGQVYVALSRCRTLEGLVLRTPIPARAVSTDPAVLGFSARIEAHFPTAADLQAARIRYQQQLLLACFDFKHLARLLGRLGGLLRVHAAVVSIAGGAEFFAAQESIQEAICGVGDRFRRQLQSLFAMDREPTGDEVVRDRLAKAGGYFQEQFESQLIPCLDGLELATDNKEVRKRLSEALALTRRECAGKLAGILACAEGFSPGRYLRALSLAAMEGERWPAKSGPVYTEADVGHPELFQKLRHWRTIRAQADNLAAYQVLHQKTLIQIAVHLPDSLAALLAIKGIGKRLTEKYGEEIVALVAAYRRDKGIVTVELPRLAVGPTGERLPTGKKEDSKKTSLEMLHGGLSIAEIAAERGLTAQTVEGHLAFFVKRGELSLDGLIAEDRRAYLEDKIEHLSTASLKSLKAALGEEFSYGEINLVLAHLQHRQGV